MPIFVIKKVQLVATEGDGFRVLVDRLWPRGVSRARAALDDWQKDLAPSPALRQWFGHDPVRFAEFADRYLAELADNEAVIPFLERVKGRRTTLLYAAHDTAVNHALVLADHLRVRSRK